MEVGVIGLAGCASQSVGLPGERAAFIVSVGRSVSQSIHHAGRAILVVGQRCHQFPGAIILAHCASLVIELGAFHSHTARVHHFSKEMGMGRVLVFVNPDLFHDICDRDQVAGLNVVSKTDLAPTVIGYRRNPPLVIVVQLKIA